MIGLDVKNITVTYKNGHTAIHDTSFSLPQGTITALVGVNGSGKSTLFKSIMGFVSLAAGSVEILGILNNSNRFAVAASILSSIWSKTGSSLDADIKSPSFYFL